MAEKLDPDAAAPAKTGRGLSGKAAEGRGDRRDEPEAARLARERDRLHAGFGQVVLAMSAVPRYRHLPLGDLMAMVLEPLVRNRIAVAATAGRDGAAPEPAGIAIWATVSAEVDARIREQIGAGVFPLRLRPEDWTSGEIRWLLDVIAPNPRVVAAVIADFRKLAGAGELRLHPLVRRLIDAETLERLGARPLRPEADDSDANTTDRGAMTPDASDADAPDAANTPREGGP